MDDEYAFGLPTVEDIHQWLRKQRWNKVVGVRWGCASCLIATYLKAHGASYVVIAPTRGEFIIDTASGRLPHDLCVLSWRFDNLPVHQDARVTAREALTLFEQAS